MKKRHILFIVLKQVNLLKKENKMKIIEELMDEWITYGYILPTCPICNNETNPTEPDNDEAYCEECGLVKPKDTLRAYGVI